MATTLAAYALVFVFFATDSRFRADEKSRKVSLEASDRKSTYLLVLAFGVSIVFLLLALVFNFFHLGQFARGPLAGWPGLILMGAGILLRVWSTRVLGRFYTRTLLTRQDQRIIAEGPYRLVRHPGYSGSLLVWIGAGLATGNAIVLAAVTLACGASYLYRMQSEEAMLLDKFGDEYRGYARRTRRLIPYLY